MASSKSYEWWVSETIQIGGLVIEMTLNMKHALMHPPGFDRVTMHMSDKPKVKKSVTIHISS